MQAVKEFLPTNRPQFRPKTDEQPFAPETPAQAVIMFPTPESWQQHIMDLHQQGIHSFPHGYCKYGCGGAGYLRRELKQGHPLFGKTIPCTCTKEKAEMGDEAKIAAYRESMSSIEQTFTLDNWIGRAQDPQAWTAANQVVVQGWGMVAFWGKVGVGKSGLLTGIVNAFLDSKVKAIYKTTTGMLDELRASYETDEYQQNLNYFSTVRVLALDEVWRHKQTEWAEENLFKILDERYRYWDRCLTVIATNATPNMSEALWSRFADVKRGGKIIEVKGRDVRPLT
jgi:DNA replication protein DnaC